MSFARSLAWAACIGAVSLFAACGDDGETATGGGGTGAGGVGGNVGGTNKPLCLTQPASGDTPSARADTAGALNADGTTMVLFGGDEALPVCGQQPSRDHVGDTWLLDTACGGWTQIMAAAAPPARARHGMSFDAARDRALVFGGRSRAGTSGNYDLYADVWAFDMATNTWSELATQGTGPSARFNAGVAVIGDTLWVFGGSTSASGTVFAPQNDLFALDLTTNTWSAVTVAARPPARLFHAMTGDAQGNKLFVFSGGDANAFLGPFIEDAWSFDVASQTWSDLGASFAEVTDPGRIKPGLLAKPGEAGATLYFFGGHDDGILGNRNDTVALDPGSAAWRNVSVGDVFNKPGTGQCDFPQDFTIVDATSPERRSAFAFAARPDGKAFVVFGGDSDCGRLSDAWWFDAELEQWVQVRETLPGLVCPRTGNPNCDALCG